MVLDSFPTVRQNQLHFKLLSAKLQIKLSESCLGNVLYLIFFSSEFPKLYTTYHRINLINLRHNEWNRISAKTW